MSSISHKWSNSKTNDIKRNEDNYRNMKAKARTKYGYMYGR